MTRRFPWWVLALVFVGLPVLEIYVVIQVGQVIGAWWTILLLLADGFLGAWLMKREGSRTWAALRRALHEGRMPARELADAALVLIGGTLLVTPGFVTDVVGLFCVLPFTRPLARAGLTGFITHRFLAGVDPGPSRRARDAGSTTGYRPPHDTAPSPGTHQRPGPDEQVVRGEVVD